MKKYLAIIFICGWLSPKIFIGGFNVGVQDISAILLLVFNYKINKKIVKIFYADLVFAFILFFLGFFYLSKLDIEGFLIGCRTLLFVFAVLSFTSFSYHHLHYILKVVLFIIFTFVSVSVIRIILNLLFNPFDAINFFYGSDSFRVKSPFEPEGAASSQVPVGYMIALILCLPTVLKSKYKRTIFMLGAIGTTSRASILSIAVVYFRNINYKKISIFFSLLILTLLLYLIFLKSFLSNDGQLDGSASKRLELYSNSISIMFSNPSSLFIGFGLSSKLLEAGTGEGFYESFVINSFMQGGVIMLLCSLWILIKSFYYDFRYNIFSISIVIFFGNIIGGSNYFSMFAYPLMGLIISLAVKKQNNISFENSASNDI